MKRSMLISLIMILLLGAIPFPSTSAQSPSNSDAPYIYYYSDLLNAFVIERADGTDSRTFGDGLAPEDTNTMLGPGWSPSGTWFAWTASLLSGFGGTLRGYQPGVVDVSGDHIVTTLDDIQDARMVWHSTQDLLFIAGVTRDTDYSDFDPENVHIRLSIIDPATDSVVSSLETVRSALRWWDQDAVPFVQWVDEDHAVAFYDEAVSREPFEMRTTVHILDRSGSITTRSLPYITRSQGGLFPTMSSNGYVAYFAASNENTMTFENVVTGEKHEIETYFNHVWAMEWNADGVSGTAYADDLRCQGAECEEVLWTFSVNDGFARANFGGFYETDQTATLERQCAYRSPQFTTWLPDFDRESQTQTVSVYECDSIELVGEYTFEEPIWQIDISSNGRYLTYIKHHVIVFDTETGTQTDLAPDGRGFYANNGGYTRWHPQQAWFMTMENSFMSGGSGRPYWVGIATPDGAVNRDLTLCNYGEPCIGWLPEQVDLSLLPAGQSQSVIPEPDRVIHATDWCQYLSWSPDGELLACDTRNVSEITVFDVESGDSISTLPELDQGYTIEWTEAANGTFTPNSVAQTADTVSIGGHVYATSANGRYAVAYDENRTVLYDVETMELLLDFGEVGALNSAFSSDGQIAIVTGQYAYLSVWAIETHQMINTFPVKGTALAFSPDGQTLAVASSWDIQLWDVESLLADANEP